MKGGGKEELLNCLRLPWSAWECLEDLCLPSLAIMSLVNFPREQEGKKRDPPLVQHLSKFWYHMRLSTCSLRFPSEWTRVHDVLGFSKTTVSPQSHDDDIVYLEAIRYVEFGPVSFY